MNNKINKIKFNYKIKFYDLIKLEKTRRKIYQKYFFYYKTNNYENSLLNEFKNYINFFNPNEKKVYYIPSVIKYLEENLNEKKLKENLNETNINTNSNSHKEKFQNFLINFNNYFEKYYYGKLKIQTGLCYGYNKYLNSLEFHKTNEILITLSPQILILADIRDIKFLNNNHKNKKNNNNKYNSLENNFRNIYKNYFNFDIKNLVSFYIPENSIIEIFSTTLHFAPISLNNNPFFSIIILPDETNTSLNEDLIKIREELNFTYKNSPNDLKYLLFSKNKWLFTHKDSPQFELKAIDLFKTNERIKLIENWKLKTRKLKNKNSL